MNLSDYNRYFTDAVSKVGENAVCRFIGSIVQSDRVITAGNGGSSSTASHFAQDLAKAIGKPSACLTDNVGLLTAFANDDSYDKALVDILETMLVTEKTLVVLLSGSGKSPNVLAVANLCRQFGVKVVALTGYDGGTLKDLCDIHIHVPLNDMETCESIHSLILHYVIKELKNGYDTRQDKE